MAKTQTKSSDAVIESAESGTADGALSAAATTEARTEKMSLADALASLDPANDDHWTADGKPRMEVLENLTGGNLTREDVEAVAPGVTRSNINLDEPTDDGAAVADQSTDDPNISLADRIAELEADNAFLRKQFGWPKRNA